mgnify:FL=1
MIWYCRGQLQKGSGLAMRVFVYKSQRKLDTYLYVAKHDDFASVPDIVQKPLLPWQFVLEFSLDPMKKLARIDAATLHNNLVEHGFYLQFPVTVLDPLVAGGVGDG